MGATRVTDLKVWEKAHQLTLGVYRLSRTLPKDERFGLISQMQRAAVSIPACISEGFIRAGSKDKAADKPAEKTPAGSAKRAVATGSGKSASRGRTTSRGKTSARRPIKKAAPKATRRR